jgi:hypothetical protein
VKLQATLDAAYEAYPHRFKGRAPLAQRPAAAVSINKPTPAPPLEYEQLA